MIRITTDSTSDLPKELIEKHNIGVIPLIVTLGEEDFFDDGESINQQKIFDFVTETNVLPKTAARSTLDFYDFFKSYVDKGETVIHIGIGAELSSAYRNATLASDELDGKVHILDSKSLSSGIGLLVLEAAKMAEKGCSVEEISVEIERLANAQQTSFVSTKLDYLYKGGRVSKFSFSIGAMIKIKPTLQMVDGKLLNTGKDMGPLKVVLKRYIDSCFTKYPKVRKERCFIAHTLQDDPILYELIDYIKSKNIFGEIIPQDAGSVITSHCGPGTFGLIYLCD